MHLIITEQITEHKKGGDKMNERLLLTSFVLVVIVTIGIGPFFEAAWADIIKKSSKSFRDL